MIHSATFTKTVKSLVTSNLSGQLSDTLQLESSVPSVVTRHSVYLHSYTATWVISGYCQLVAVCFFTHMYFFSVKVQTALKPLYYNICFDGFKYHLIYSKGVHFVCLLVCFDASIGTISVYELFFTSLLFLSG